MGVGLVLCLLVTCGWRAFSQSGPVVLASDGAWSWFSDPRALFQKGWLYFGYVRNGDSRAVLSAYNPETGEKKVLWTSAQDHLDERANPALLLCQNEQLLALYPGPGAHTPLAYRLSTSTAPVSPRDWLSERTLPVAGVDVTYATPHQLSAEGGSIYNFCRALNSNPTLLLSTNGGTQWSAPQLFILTGSGTTRPYFKTCSDGVRRIDFLYTDGHPRETRNSLYHAYYQDGAVYQSDGTLLKRLGDLPLRHDLGERGTPVYEYSTVEGAAPEEHLPRGRAWCWDLAYQTNHQPVCVFSVRQSHVAGTNWLGDRIYYYYAWWTGSAWQKRLIAQAGHPLQSFENDFAGGICLDPDDPRVVYLSSSAAAPFDLALTNTALRPSRCRELFRGITPNGGQSFEWTALTTNSTADNLRPYVPRNHGKEPVVLWMRGNYLSPYQYNCAIVGLVPRPAASAAEPPYESRLWRMEDGLPHNSVRAVLQARDGFMWVGTRQGLVRFDGFQFQPYAPLTNTPITGLAEESDGRIWVATEGLGPRVCQAEQCGAPPAGARLPAAIAEALAGAPPGAAWGAATNELSSSQSEKLRWLAPAAHTLFRDHAGTVWLGGAAGLSYLTRDGTSGELKHEGGALDAVYAICEDSEANLWVGARDGLHRFTRKHFTTYTRQHGLANNDVTSVLADAAGRLWIGTWGGGLHQLTEGKIAHIAVTNRFFNGLVLGLATDRSGALWVGTDYEGGMFRYDRSGFTHYWKQQGLSLLADPAIRTILIDHQHGRVWVGSRDALNVAFRSQPFQRYTTSNGLAGNSVHAFLEDHQGHIWVGTDGGLTEFQGDHLRNFTTRDGLSHNMVTALYEDAHNTLWIATAGGGLNRLSLVETPIASSPKPTPSAGSPSRGPLPAPAPQPSRITAYTTHQGLFSDELFEVIEDNCNRLWMTCRAGVFWVAKEDLEALDAGKVQSLRCVSYGKDDGLQGAPGNTIAKPAACKTDDGRLWFATVNGLSVVDPHEVPNTHSPPPPVVIQELLLDGKSFLPGRQLEVPAGRGELEIRFSALTFRGPERARFKYRLEGVDREWVEAGMRRFAHYNNLYPGHYRFRVLACNSDGVWNEAGTVLALVLLPNPWQTWWFKLGVLVALGLLVAGLVLVRLTRRREMERLRLRIAADLHDEISGSLGSIGLLTQRIQKSAPLPPDQRQDLATIQRIANQAANSIRDIVWFLNPKYDTLQDLLARMEDATATLGSAMRLRFTSPQEELSRKLAPDFRRNLFFMFKEILGNIAKHSQATEVDIVVLDKKGVWLLMVTDNGVGFDPGAEHGGQGLRNLYHRARRLGGTLEIRSQPGGGTTVIFSTRKE